MLGQVTYISGTWGKPELGRLYGLPVLRAEADPTGRLGEFRLRRAGRNLSRGGVVQTLVPHGFERWELLERSGLMPVDPVPLIRHQGGQLALERLRRDGVTPERASVALCAGRVDRTVERAAAILCERVRYVSVSVPQGGEELARRLHKTYGIPVLPPGEGTGLALCFGPGKIPPAGRALNLYGPAPDLAGMRFFAPALAPEDRGDLLLLAALWNGGKLDEHTLKIT